MGCGLDGNFLDYENLRASGTVFLRPFVEFYGNYWSIERLTADLGGIFAF